MTMAKTIGWAAMIVLAGILALGVMVSMAPSAEGVGYDICTEVLVEPLCDDYADARDDLDDAWDALGTAVGDAGGTPSAQWSTATADYQEAVKVVQTAAADLRIARRARNSYWSD